MAPSKTVKINGTARLIAGVAEDDPYFSGLADNVEEDFATFCRRHLKDDYLCWDIGANIGITSFIMADVCSRGSVVALDGGEKVSELHRRNVEANHVGNVEVYHAAMTEQDEDVGFAENSAFGGVNKAAPKVPSISPRRLVEMKGAPPDFVKIDVEGYEYPIMTAAMSIFKQNGTLVQFEFNTWAMVINNTALPLSFLQWIESNFEYVFVRSPGQSGLEPLSSLGCVGMLARNMTQQPYTFLDDIVVTTDRSRLNFA